MRVPKSEFSGSKKRGDKGGGEEGERGEGRGQGLKGKEGGIMREKGGRQGA